MGKNIKKLIKSGSIVKEPRSLEDFLEFDLENPEDIVEFHKHKLLYQLNEYMLKNKISKSDLAKKLGITRQAVTNKFLGETLSLDWLVRAFAALGVGIEMKELPDNFNAI
ncbi:MAG: helix-turn-helix domain-containing protein [Deltaproteobacteria bacterium]|nr:helix-turn-helix domain-containing protein [Deltaproteobacteria bacterium]